MVWKILEAIELTGEIGLRYMLMFLIIIGTLIMTGIVKIPWHDPAEAVPAFLTIIGIPLTFSIADGMALGFISYALLKLLSGRFKEDNPAFYVISIVFLVLFIARLYIK